MYPAADINAAGVRVHRFQTRLLRPDTARELSPLAAIQLLLARLRKGLLLLAGHATFTSSFKFDKARPGRDGFKESLQRGRAGPFTTTRHQS